MKVIRYPKPMNIMMCLQVGGAACALCADVAR